MLRDAFRYALEDSATREASAYATGAVLATGVFVRLGTALWPSWTAVFPAVLATVPAALFVAHLAVILRDSASGPSATPVADTNPTAVNGQDDSTSFRLTWNRVRLGCRVFAVASAYLLVPGVLIAAGGYLIASGVGPEGAMGLVASIIATIALLVIVAFAYLLPGAIAVGARDGVQAALQRSALRGLGSGSYFVAWTGGTVLTVLGWGAVSSTTPGSVGGFIAVLWFTYANLTAARLVGLGLAGVRTRARTAGG